MYRYSALSLVGLLLTGCVSQTPRDDPFFGRTRLPPPPTGSVTGRAADPYYQTPPVVQMSSGAVAGSAGPAAGMPSAAPGLSAATPPPTPPSNSPSYRYSPPTAATPPPAAIPAGSASPPGIAPNLLAPRPLSTAAPRSSAMPGSVPAGPPAGPSTPSTVPNGGWSSPGPATPAAASPPAGAPPLAQPGARAPLPGSIPVTVSRIGPSSADRSPRPVDDAGAGASLAERKPAAGPLPPRANGSSADDVPEHHGLAEVAVAAYMLNFIERTCRASPRG